MKTKPSPGQPRDVPLRTLATCALFGVATAGTAQAVCTKVNYSPTTGMVAPTHPQYVDPAYGTHAIWLGAQKEAGTSGLTATSINITTTPFQPDGTLLASGTANFLDMGAARYGPEQVLFRCDATDAPSLREFCALDARVWYGGMYEDGAQGGVAPSAYRSYHKGLVFRLTHVATGHYFRSTWQSRALTGLERDGAGKILVKAKNFSNVRVELIRFSNESISDGVAGTGLYPEHDRAAVVAFQGGGIAPGLRDGTTTAVAFDGEPFLWPGAINFTNSLIVRRAAACAVTSVTPTVVFTRITAAELESGAERRVPIDIEFRRNTARPLPAILRSGFLSGTEAGRTAMGVLAPPSNHQSAVREGLDTSGGGATFLLSNDYGLTGVAGGVGVQLSYAVDSTPMNLLSTEQVTGGGTAAGWYPVLQGATSKGEVAGVTSHATRLFASLKKIPGKTVTPGRFDVWAQVVIRVQ